MGKNPRLAQAKPKNDKNISRLLNPLKKEQEIQKDLDDGIGTIRKRMTVCELYTKQNRHRGNVRHNTTKGRERLMELLEADKLGFCPIGSMKLFDAKE